MLKDLDLLPVYDSAEHDLLEDLVVPLLRNSHSYLRGVGFFTSGWLRLAAHGLAELINCGGTARIVLSPIMEVSDWEALQLGEKAKQNDALRRILENNIQDLAKGLEHDTLNALAWMIADRFLDFKFAVARSGFEGGDYHDKVALFLDAVGDSVAIHGSFNDTIKGTLNGEAFSVFKSWDGGQRPFVDRHRKRLIGLWEGDNSQFAVFGIPEAARQSLVKLRSTSLRPYNRSPGGRSIAVLSPDAPSSSVRLREYQEKALQAWVGSGCRGVFDMATGTGKTFTSLACAVDRYQELGRIAVVILVPYLHLLDQWKEHCEGFKFRPVLCSSSHENWQLRVKQKIQDFNIKAVDNICILAVHKTASTEGFSKALSGLKAETTMLIGDEVHWLGAGALRQAMVHNAGMRLGLSATPRRWFDEEGTDAIFSYFGAVCFEFPLEDAIGRFLTPYEYRPELVTLSDDELQTYEVLTSSAGKLASIKPRTHDLDEKLKRLLLKRAAVVSSAIAKEERLLAILRVEIQKAEIQGSELRHVLVYCAPGSHRSTLAAVASLGIRCREFVHTVPMDERRTILEQFSKGDLQAIVAVRCLDEGVDVPAARTAFLLASTSNPREFVQRRGRILRLAEGKHKTTIYDFIVVPREEYVPLRRNVDMGLLKREMPRFAEFACGASNEFEARAQVRFLLDQYEMLGLLDLRPWDVYRQLSHDDDSMIFSE